MSFTELIKYFGVMRKFYPLILLAVAITFLQSCRKNDTEFVVQPDAENFDAKVAVDWMHLYQRVVQSEAKNPPQASRIYAYGAIGLYQSVFPGMRGYRSLEGQVPGLINLPYADMSGRIDYTVASNEALYLIASKIFVALKPENIQKIEGLHKSFVDESQLKLPADLVSNSKQFGARVADAVLNRANNDNFASTRNLSYTVPTTHPSFWAPTSAVTVPLEPYWGKIKCFAMAEGGACTIKSTIPFNTTTSSEFYKQANEVLTTSFNLTTEQKAIASWWADNGGQTATPPGHWVAIADQLITRQNLNLAKAAEIYTTLNIGLADAFISCWDEKFKLNLLRPVTYIRNHISGNSNWSPMLPTPPFPEYPSGHSVASAAAGEILTRLIGEVSFVDSANTYLGYAPRSFKSFRDAASEAAISRLYGGIHYREAIEKGLMQGKEVSKAVFEKIKLRR
jgi:hypothetical protein